MNFVSAGSLVERARDCGYAVPALNTNGGTYDITRAALEAARELSAPVILQVYEPNTEYRGIEYFAIQAAFLCDQMGVSVPVALQLDHGHSFESVSAAMNAGLTAVMFDGSHEPYETNVRETRRVVQAARARGVAVEAELGHVTGNEPPKEKLIGRTPVPEQPDGPAPKTNVAEAVRFVKDTGVDMLAVAIGSVHGVWQRQTNLDFELLEELRGALSVPLVMHGTGGISLEDLSRLAAGGMAKVNFGEPFRYNFIRYFDELTDTMDHRWHPWRILREVKDRLKDDMKKLIVALGANGKANP